MTEYVIKDNQSSETIWTAEELEHMFPNKSQRDIFIKGICTLLNGLIQRGSLHAMRMHFND